MKKTKFNVMDLIPIITLVVIFVFFSIYSGGRTVSLYNIKNIVIAVLPVAIGALGVIFVVSLGSTDISVGGNAALSATLGGYIAGAVHPALFIPVTLIISMAIGVLVGFVVTKFRMPSFMTTLAFLIALKGLLNYTITVGLVYPPAGSGFIKEFWFALILLVILCIIAYFVFERTRFGYYCKCIGENERTVSSVGINVRKIRMICFVISGLMAGIFGFITFVKVGGSSNSLCNMMEMKIQMAIFLGGILVSGGFSAKLYKVIIGSITIAVIENGLTISQVPSTVSEAVEGILLIVILIVTVTFSRKAQIREAEGAKKGEAAAQ